MPLKDQALALPSGRPPPPVALVLNKTDLMEAGARDEFMIALAKRFSSRSGGGRPWFGSVGAGGWLTLVLAAAACGGCRQEVGAGRAGRWQGGPLR
jgi:hypothetical protein